MDIQTAFWILLVITVLELLALFTLGNSIKSTLKSDFFKRKIDASRNTDNLDSGGSIRKAGTTLLVLLAAFAPNFMWAADVDSTANTGSWLTVTKSMLYALLIINVILLAVLVYLQSVLRSIFDYGKTKEEIAATSGVQNSKFMHILTDAVPVSEEYKIETDHEYDGIRELDNNLPPWWIYGFYISIIAAGIYLVRYHVTKTANLQIAEYQESLDEADKEIEAYLLAHPVNVDESSVTQLTDASAISVGKKLYDDNCVACHKSGGAGLVGPNLTDEFWIHGGGIKNIFGTIKNGAPNGMKSWADDFNGEQMQKIASYVMSLKYIAPADGGKEPQGDKYDAGADASTAATTGEKTATEEGNSEETAVGGATSEAGKKIFKKNCMVCHKFNGGGSVGPNLTDEFWKNGGKDEDLIKTITNGVDGTSMTPWGTILSDDDIKEVVTYIRSLEPVSPPDGKEPEGDKYTP